MPKFYGDEEDVKNQKPRRRCDGLREDILTCLLKSECVRIEKKTPKTCLKEKHPSVEECQPLCYALFECKRGMIDMRLRFRGQKGY